MTDLAKRESEFLLYIAPDRAVKVSVLFRDETAWLTQRALAELFGGQDPRDQGSGSLAEMAASRSDSSDGV
jgi:hypothetical protein